MEDLGRARFAQTRPDRPDVDFFFEQIFVGMNWFDHRFHWRRRGDDLVNFFRHEDFDKSGAGAQRALRRHKSGAEKSSRPRDDTDPAELIFVGAEFPARQERVKRMRSGGELVPRAAFQRKIDKRNHFKASDEVEYFIDNQSMFGETDRDRE